MKFKIQQTVDFVNLTPVIADKDKTTEYIIRSIGLMKYGHELQKIMFGAPKTLEDHLGAYIKDIGDSIGEMHTIIAKYYNTLYDTMGFSADEAAVETWEVFKKQIESFADIYYDLYEIDHYTHLLKNASLVI